MRRCLPTLPLTLLLAALGCGAASLPPYNAAAPRRADPEAYWERIFFGTIDERVDAANLANLRQVSLQGDELEVRIWAGFGLGRLRGVVLRRSAAGWIGLHLEPPEERNTGAREITPRGGWDALWARIEREGLLVLPDSATLKPGPKVADGICYVVEINRKGTYRAYHYCNPSDQYWPEGHRFLRIARALDTRFGITSFLSSDEIPWHVPNGMYVLVRRGRVQGAFAFDYQSGSHDPDGRVTSMAGKYRWAFREGGSGPLVGVGVETGQGVADENTPVRFGPFQIRWYTSGQRIGALRYASAKDSSKDSDGEIEIAPTLDGWEQVCLLRGLTGPHLSIKCELDPAKLQIENIDPADPRWRYEALSDIE